MLVRPDQPSARRAFPNSEQPAGFGSFA
jgi:hypothetical protein